MKKAIFPGSFDPFTKGHFDIVNRALPLFDEIIIGIGHNTTKQYLLPLAQRMEQIEILYKDNSKVKVLTFEGLTTVFAAKMNCHFIIRGIRNTIDFEYEKSIADMNKKMDANIETIFLNCSPQLASISSTIVREIIKSGGDVSQFLP
ncbi:MAG: pantetheine-phosphate adenylyltransferase [Bacteroidota bacterium]|jgi:pantetheine-phosphate adenylyltransferase